MLFEPRMQDHASLETLARDHRGFLLALARKLCRRNFDPEDLVQDALVKTCAHRLPEGVNPRAWLTQVMKHLFIDQLRRARTHSRGMEPVTEPLDEAPWWHALDASHVCAAMAQLPVEQRDTFERFAFRGESYDAIAATLGISKSTVGTRILRARRRIKQLLEQHQERE